MCITVLRMKKIQFTKLNCVIPAVDGHQSHPKDLNTRIARAALPDTPFLLGCCLFCWLVEL